MQEVVLRGETVGWWRGVCGDFMYFIYNFSIKQNYSKRKILHVAVIKLQCFSLFPKYLPTDLC